MAFTPEVRAWTIYRITNPKGRVYIGKTYNYTKRFFTYKGLHCKTQPILYQSLKKYGFENHKIEKIDLFESNSSFAAGKEMFWIRTYMSNRSKWPELKGLNLTDGGDGSIGKKYTPEQTAVLSKRMKGKRYRLGISHSEETKKKISETKIRKQDGKGKRLSEEAKQNLRIIHTGLKHSEETKKKLSEKLKGKRYPDRKRYSKEYCIERMEKFRKKVSQHALTGELICVFDSVGMAAEAVKGSKSGVANCARGVNNTYKGFTYKYI